MLYIITHVSYSPAANPWLCLLMIGALLMGPAIAIGSVQNQEPYSPIFDSDPEYQTAHAALQSNQYETALEAYGRLADRQHPGAFFDLGVMHEEGLGVAPDQEKAITFYERAAEKQHIAAQVTLGHRYYEGRGVDRDLEVAAHWFAQAAQHDDHRGQHALAYLHANGKGVGLDKQSAANWYRRAAKNGNGRSQHNLAIMYERGDGVPRNYIKAACWYKQAAEQGYELAQLSIGRMYKEGKGYTRDIIESYKWLSLAASQGNSDARVLLDEIEDVMSSDEIANAQKSASSFESRTGPFLDLYAAGCSSLYPTSQTAASTSDLILPEQSKEEPKVVNLVLEPVELHPGIFFPFPHEPRSEGEMRQGMWVEKAWAADASAIGFTASISLASPELPEGLDEQQLLYIASSNVADAMSAETLSRESLSVSGYPALKMVAEIDYFGIVARSHTLLVSVDGMVHTWAIQYAREQFGSQPEEMFSKGIQMIEISPSRDVDNSGNDLSHAPGARTSSSINYGMAGLAAIVLMILWSTFKRD